MGTLGPRPRLLPFFPLPLPLGGAGPEGLLGDLERLGCGFGFGEAVLVVPAAGKGNKWNVTDGWESTCWSSASKGNLPCSSLFRVVMRSAMSTQAARSARNSWAKETDE